MRSFCIVFDLYNSFNKFHIFLAKGRKDKQKKNELV